MSLRSTRREFLRNTAATGLGVWIADRSWANTKSPNERVNFACIGVGGKGDSDTADAARLGNVVAICDVDDNTLARAAMKYPNAKKYNDYRKMFDEMAKEIDAVTVSTPDHTHAPAALMAMHLHKHCFCQKPLAHSIYEAHRMGEVARQMKVATQMGNQGTASSALRKHAAQIRAGAVGVVKEVHVWTNRPIWPQGLDRLPTADVPSNLHWDLWLGTAPTRPYGRGPNGEVYAPFAWRGWWDFGTGALGDMACHTVNMPFMALDLRNPLTVVAESSGTNKDSYPKSAKMTFQFAANSQRPAVTMYWYEGGRLPSPDLLPDTKYSDSGFLIVGDKGKFYSAGDYGDAGRLIDGVEIDNVNYIESPGHFDEFVRAIKGGEPAMSNFPDYAAPLTQTILLGNLAVWAEGKTVEWDAEHMRAKNAPEVASIVHPHFRHGYGNTNI